MIFGNFQISKFSTCKGIVSPCADRTLPRQKPARGPVFLCLCRVNPAGVQTVTNLTAARGGIN